MFDDDSQQLRVVYRKFTVKINHKSNFAIMREMWAVGQSRSHGGEAKFDFKRKYQGHLIYAVKFKKVK